MNLIKAIVSILPVVCCLAAFPLTGNCGQVFFDNFEDGLSQ
jgi:hypothetical protein